MIKSLNPCFNGRYPRGFWYISTIPKFVELVLILVLVEDTLEAATMDCLLRQMV